MKQNKYTPPTLKTINRLVAKKHLQLIERICYSNESLNIKLGAKYYCDVSHSDTIKIPINKIKGISKIELEIILFQHLEKTSLVSYTKNNYQRFKLIGSFGNDFCEKLSLKLNATVENFCSKDTHKKTCDLIIQCHLMKELFDICKSSRRVYYLKPQPIPD
jgi:hypothetical protein